MASPPSSQAHAITKTPPRVCLTFIKLQLLLKFYFLKFKKTQSAPAVTTHRGRTQESTDDHDHGSSVTVTRRTDAKGKDIDIKAKLPRYGSLEHDSANA